MLFGNVLKANAADKVADIALEVLANVHPLGVA